MLKITWEGKVGPKLLKSFKAVLKKSHKSLNNNLVTMHSLPETFQTTRFWNWSLFPLWFWGLESTALWGPGRRFSDIGELKSFHAPSVFRPADKGYPFSPTIFSYLQCCRGFAGLRALTGTGDCIPPFSHAVLVTAAWLQQLSHKPETLKKLRHTRVHIILYSRALGNTLRKRPWRLRLILFLKLSPQAHTPLWFINIRHVYDINIIICWKTHEGNLHHHF